MADPRPPLPRGRRRGLRRAALLLLPLGLLARSCGPAWLAAAFDEAVTEAKEVLVVSLTQQARSGAGGAEKLWLDLARAQEKRGSLAAAVRSCQRALEEAPESHFAALNQALLLVRHEGPSGVARAEELLRLALESVPQSPGALWNLGLLQAYNERPEAKGTLRRALEATKRLGWSPRRLAMVMALTPEAMASYEQQLQQETAAFAAYCAERGDPALAALPEALAELRRLPEDVDWLLEWAAEAARTFGPDVTAAAYGETLFPAWRVVASSEFVAPLLEGAKVRILGCALGYQCLFFLAAGAESCVGVDMMAESMVRRGQAAAQRHGVANMRLEVGDAAVAALDDADILWLNDEVWPEELRRAVLSRAARELRPGAVVVSYGPGSPGELVEGLEVAEALRADTSWCPAEKLRVLRAA